MKQKAWVYPLLWEICVYIPDLKKEWDKSQRSFVPCHNSWLSKDLYTLNFCFDISLTKGGAENDFSLQFDIYMNL